MLNLPNKNCLYFSVNIQHEQNRFLKNAILHFHNIPFISYLGKKCTFKKTKYHTLNPGSPRAKIFYQSSPETALFYFPCTRVGDKRTIIVSLFYGVHDWPFGWPLFCSCFVLERTFNQEEMLFFVLPVNWSIKLWTCIVLRGQRQYLLLSMY